MFYQRSILWCFVLFQIHFSHDEIFFFFVLFSKLYFTEYNGKCRKSCSSQTTYLGILSAVKFTLHTDIKYAFSVIVHRTNDVFREKMRISATLGRASN